MLYIGVDIGGTGIKGILSDEDGKVLVQKEVDTRPADGASAVCQRIAALVKSLATGNEDKIEGVGIGCPGMVDRVTGTVIFASNLRFKNLALAERIKSLTGYKVAVGNDAHVAALGEAKFGASANYKNSILVTLGTGVGGGIMIDGKLFEGTNCVGSEIGHMVVYSGGRICSCGRKGCFEAYASATALRGDLIEALRKNKGSKIWNTETLISCTAKTAFDFLGKDRVADSVVENYIEALSEGLANLANIFRPEVIMLGGGVSAQGDVLTKPLQKKVNEKIFGGTAFSPVKIMTASLGNMAGALGAVALVMGYGL
ncbi:MAG: ROK family protein [Clostridia bacterium]|nr:ROK family protein [Clostridia bacterium]